MKTLAVAFFAACLAGQAIAAAPSGEDATTRPDRNYSTNAQALDSTALVPPPPSFDSITFQQDQTAYRTGKMQRNTPRGELAVLDAQSGKLAESLSEPFGIAITKEGTPEIHKLVTSLRGELGGLHTRAAKRKYFRVRPFVYYGEPTCYPKDEERLSKDGSYPSGHAARGWALSIILSQINPRNKEAILKRGYDMGQSRVICGYHWKSDVEAGRLVGAASIAIVYSHPKFVEQLEKAKAEFKRLADEGKVRFDN